MKTLSQLDLIAVPKTKLTLLVVGGGMFGCDVRKLVVSKGWVGTQRGEQLCYSEPRGRKIFGFLPILRSGVIVLRGHQETRPVFEAHARAVGGSHSFVLDGRGGRFIDYNEEGAEALIVYLKQHLVLHTLSMRNTITLLKEMKDPDGDERPVADPDFKRKLLEALGPATEMEPEAPKEPERKALLTPRMKTQLLDRRLSKAKYPLFKIFSPEGASTWLLCSMEADEDTLWAVCDLGQGVVEYGTVSLGELETARGPQFKLPMELDLHFDGTRYTVTALLERESLSGI